MESYNTTINEKSYTIKIFDKKEMNFWKVLSFVRAGFNARRNDEEQKYLFLTNELLGDVNPKLNPYFNYTDSKFVIAYRNGNPVGRVIITYDPLYNEYHKKYNRDPVVWFQWLEFENKYLGKYLLDKSVDIAKEFKNKKDNEIKYLIGPGQPNENGIVGLRTERNFIYFMEPNNPIRYKDIFDKIPIDDYWYSLKFNEKDLKKWKYILEKFDGHVKDISNEKNSTFKIIQLNKSNVKKHLGEIEEIYKNAWDSEEHKHGRILKHDEFVSIFNGLKLILPKNWDNSYIAYKIADKKNEGSKKSIYVPIGAAVSLPNYYEKFKKHESFGIKILNELSIFLNNKNYKTGRIFIEGAVNKIDGIDIPPMEKSSIVGMLTTETLKWFEEHDVNPITMSQVVRSNKDVIIPLVKMFNPKKYKDLNKLNYEGNIDSIIGELAKYNKVSIASVYKMEP